MPIFFYFCYKLTKLISKDLAHAKIAFRLLRKQNQMNFETKTSQNQFLLMLSETQEQNLEEICQKFSS